MSEYSPEHIADFESTGRDLRDEIRQTRRLLVGSLWEQQHGRMKTKSIDLGGEHMGTRSLPMTIVYGEEDRDDFTDWLSNHLDRKVKKYGYVQAHWTSGGGHTESLAYFVGKDVYVPSDQGKKHIVEATQRDMQEIQDSLLLPLVDELAKVSV